MRCAATTGSATRARTAGACLGLRRGVFPARRSPPGGGRAVPSRRAQHPGGRGLDGFVSPTIIARPGRKEAPTLRVVLSRKHAFAGQLAPQRMRGWGSPFDFGDGTPGPRVPSDVASYETRPSAAVVPCPHRPTRPATNLLRRTPGAAWHSSCAARRGGAPALALPLPYRPLSDPGWHPLLRRGILRLHCVLVS
jgi:hypothetical protein